MITIRIVAIALLTCVVSPVFAASKPPVEVTTCGQAIPRGTVGYLTADLDCSGYDAGPGAVMVSRAATFELRGFRVTGGLFGVFCGELRPDKYGEIRLYSSRCAVVGGGGTIGNAEAHGIAGEQLTVSDVTIENSGQEGIEANRKARITNVVVTGSGLIGVRVAGPATVRGSSVTGSGRDGIMSTRKLRISDSTVLGNGMNTDECVPSWSCVDLRSTLRPRVDDTQCGTSGGSSIGTGSWHVCANE